MSVTTFGRGRVLLGSSVLAVVTSCNLILDLDEVRDNTGAGAAGAFSTGAAGSSANGGRVSFSNPTGGVNGSLSSVQSGGSGGGTPTNVGGSLPVRTAESSGGANLAGAAGSTQTSLGGSASGADGGKNGFPEAGTGNASGGHEAGGTGNIDGGASALACGDPLPLNEFPLVLVGSTTRDQPAGGAITEGTYRLVSVTIYGTYDSVPWRTFELRGGNVHSRYADYSPKGAARTGYELVGKYAVAGAALALDVMNCTYGGRGQEIWSFTATPTQITITDTESSTAWVQTFTLVQ